MISNYLFREFDGSTIPIRNLSNESWVTGTNPTFSCLTEQARS